MSTSGFAVDVKALCRDFETLKKSERNRHEFVQTLIDQIKRLDLEREKNAKALRATEVLANTYQDRCESAERQIIDLRRAIDCDAFVLVLIDGDSTLFHDSYVKDGLQGGERAARDLRQALFGFLMDKPYFKHDFRIVTRIYVNLAGLFKTYCDAKITPDHKSFHQFAHGFNKTHVFSEIIDAGNGKEGADSKIKAEFELFQRNLHCKQIVLASSGDNGYGGLLRQHAPGTSRSERITLIEALPLVHELRLLADSFEIVRFVDIFRTTKIVKGCASSGGGRTRTRTPSSTSYSTFTSTDTLPVAQSSAARAITVTGAQEFSKVHTTNQPETKAVPSSFLPPSFICVNHLDQRIDEALTNTPSKTLLNTIRRLKLCNKHHIARTCNNGGSCGYKHAPQLTPHQLEALRCVARLKPCEQGLKCRDPMCFDGHECSAGAKCANRCRTKGVIAEACWFPDAMHAVDKSKLRVVYV